MIIKSDEWVDDDFIFVIAALLPFFMVLSYIVPFTRLTSKLVAEKETKVKESMKMMGMSDSAFWCSYYITYLFVYTFIAFFNTLITQFTVFKYSNILLVFLFF